MIISQSISHMNNRWVPHSCERDLMKMSNFTCRNVSSQLPIKKSKVKKKSRKKFIFILSGRTKLYKVIIFIFFNTCEPH